MQLSDRLVNALCLLIDRLIVGLLIRFRQRRITIATGATDRVSFFAGKVTHSTRATTVHGALENGIRAAHEVLSMR